MQKVAKIERKGGGEIWAMPNKKGCFFPKYSLTLLKKKPLPPSLPPFEYLVKFLGLYEGNCLANTKSAFLILITPSFEQCYKKLQDWYFWAYLSCN